MQGYVYRRDTDDLRAALRAVGVTGAYRAEHSRPVWTDPGEAAFFLFVRSIPDAWRRLFKTEYKVQNIRRKRSLS